MFAFQLAIFLVVLFRWFILHRFLGTKRMFLFDAVMWVAIAAGNFAAVRFSAFDGWSLISLICTGLCIFWSYGAAKKFLHYDELVKAASNGQEESKSDEGSDQGS